MISPVPLKCCANTLSDTRLRHLTGAATHSVRKPVHAVPIIAMFNDCVTAFTA
jgi:hypothetical protein